MSNCWAWRIKFFRNVTLARGAHHKTDDAPDDRRIRIEPEEFLRRYHRLLEGKRQDKGALKNLPHLNLVYETDLMDSARHQATADRICKALDLPPRPVRTDLRRISGTGWRIATRSSKR